MTTTRTRRLLLLPAVVLLSTAGCKSWEKKKRGCDTCPPPPPPGALIAPSPAGPPGGATLLPPAPPPPGISAADPGAAPPPPSFPSGSGFPPVASFYPNPAVRLAPPDSVAQAPAAAAPTVPAPTPPAPTPPAKSPGVRLLAPEFGPSSATPTPAAPAPATPPPAATPSLPVGIVDFAPAIPDKVAAGRKPALEGLDWLKANGYKAVVMFRGPGESDAADRKQVEARGLAFTSLEVSPQTLSWMTVDAFAKLVSEPSTQPLFVYDADGSLAGGLWYLYFRRVERVSDEAARLRATRLGLKESTDGPHREMWLAVQRLLRQV